VAVALLCSRRSLEPELGETVLWRQDVDRRMARTADEVRRITREARPDIAVLDASLPEVKTLVRELRRYPRQVSIVVLAEAGADEVELIGSGANAVLRPPPGPSWDETLARLLAVPPRKHTRVPVYFEVAVANAGEVKVGLGTILNLSVNGVLVETDHPLRLGDGLGLRFRLPVPAGPVQGEGRVVRLDRARRFGIEFRALQGGGRDEVARFVADHRTEMIDASDARPRRTSSR
jgi:CheY-like chemotaxis protein